MKRIFDNPEITVKVFAAENIVTTSATPESVKNQLINGNSGITLDNQAQIDTNKVITFVL